MVHRTPAWLSLYKPIGYNGAIFSLHCLMKAAYSKHMTYNENEYIQFRAWANIKIMEIGREMHSENLNGNLNYFTLYVRSCWLRCGGGERERERDYGL